MMGAYYYRIIVFLDLWTRIFLSVVLPTSSFVSLWFSHLKKNCISIFLICKPSYFPHIELQELLIFFSGSFTLTSCHVSNAKELGPSILEICQFIEIQCFGGYWQTYWFTSQYDKFKKFIHILRVNVVSFFTIGP